MSPAGGHNAELGRQLPLRQLLGVSGGGVSGRLGVGEGCLYHDPPCPASPEPWEAVVAAAAQVRSKATLHRPRPLRLPHACRGGCVPPKFKTLMTGTQLLWPVLLLFAENVLF